VAQIVYKERFPPIKSIKMECLPIDHLCHGDKDCTGCLLSLPKIGPSLTFAQLACSIAGAKKKLAKKVDTSTGNSSVCSSPKSPSPLSKKSLDNPFMASSHDLQQPMSTFGKKLLASMDPSSRLVYRYFK